MGYDRIIEFPPGKRPDMQLVKWLVEDYFDAVATNVKWTGAAFMVDIVGKTSPAPSRQPDVPPYAVYVDPARANRWIEVWFLPGSNTINVETRNQDDCVMALADGLARCMARVWDGELEGGT